MSRGVNSLPEEISGYVARTISEEINDYVSEYVADELSEVIDDLEKLLVSIKNSENHEDAIEAACEGIEKLDQISEVIFG